MCLRWKAMLADQAAISSFYSENAVLHIDVDSFWQFKFRKIFDVREFPFVCRGKQDIGRAWHLLNKQFPFVDGFGKDCSSSVVDCHSLIMQSKMSAPNLNIWIHGRFMTKVGCELKIEADHVEILDISDPVKATDKTNLNDLSVKKYIAQEGRDKSDMEVREAVKNNVLMLPEYFNSKNFEGLANLYHDKAVMTVDVNPPDMKKQIKQVGYSDPIILHGQEKIQLLWKRLINKMRLTKLEAFKDGTGGAEFWSTCVLSDDTVLVRSKWNAEQTDEKDQFKARIDGYIHSQLMVHSPSESKWLMHNDFMLVDS